MSILVYISYLLHLARTAIVPEIMSSIMRHDIKSLSLLRVYAAMKSKEKKRRENTRILMCSEKSAISRPPADAFRIGLYFY